LAHLLMGVVGVVLYAIDSPAVRSDGLESASWWWASRLSAGGVIGLVAFLGYLFFSARGRARDGDVPPIALAKSDRAAAGAVIELSVSVVPPGADSSSPSPQLNAVNSSPHGRTVGRASAYLLIGLLLLTFSGCYVSAQLRPEPPFAPGQGVILCPAPTTRTEAPPEDDLERLLGSRYRSRYRVPVVCVFHVPVSQTRSEDALRNVAAKELAPPPEPPFPTDPAVWERKLTEHQAQLKTWEARREAARASRPTSSQNPQPHNPDADLIDVVELALANIEGRPTLPPDFPTDRVTWEKALRRHEEFVRAWNQTQELAARITGPNGAVFSNGRDAGAGLTTGVVVAGSRATVVTDDEDGEGDRAVLIRLIRDPSLGPDPGVLAVVRARDLRRAEP